MVVDGGRRRWSTAVGVVAVVIMVMVLLLTMVNMVMVAMVMGVRMSIHATKYTYPLGVLSQQRPMRRAPATSSIAVRALGQIAVRLAKPWIRLE